MDDMNIHIITLFPEPVELYTSAGILGKAREKGLLTIHTVQLRDYATGRHKTVDDYQYGGGAGMILKPEPLTAAIQSVRVQAPDAPLVVTTPHGRLFNNHIARHYGNQHEWIIICGHYGGIDRRVIDRFATDEISIGDYVLCGGELPALIMIEAAARFIPGVLGNEDSATDDTFEDGLLGAPLYTRPPEFDGQAVPEILQSGHHANIEKWRREQKLLLTRQRRPDLIEKAALSPADRKFLDSLGNTPDAPPDGRLNSK